jgi:ABC-type uncharacterized transport system substrate-binding protein
MLTRRAVVRAPLGLAGLALLAGCRGGSPVDRAAAPPPIGYLASSLSAVRDPTDDAFHAALDELGYRDGQNLSIAYRFTDGQEERLPALVAELLQLPLRLLVAAGPTAAAAARAATRTLPIVMIAGSFDPVRMGWIDNFARPGGNLTGVASPPFGVFADKQLALLHEALPAARRVVVLLHASYLTLFRTSPTPDTPVVLSAAEQALVDELLQTALRAAQAAGVQLEPVAARTLAEVEEAVAALPVPGVDAVYLLDHPLWTVHAARIATWVAQRQLPLVATSSRWAAAGALLVYGPSLEAFFRRAAAYVDKILRGVAPAELPVEQPATFDLMVNLRAARALGLTIAPSLLNQATEVIP